MYDLVFVCELIFFIMVSMSQLYNWLIMD